MDGLYPPKPKPGAYQPFQPETEEDRELRQWVNQQIERAIAIKAAGGIPVFMVNGKTWRESGFEDHLQPATPEQVRQADQANERWQEDNPNLLQPLPSLEICLETASSPTCELTPPPPPSPAKLPLHWSRFRRSWDWATQQAAVAFPRDIG
jgi:hypothetical protein